ncbi:hypothetical protein KIW84_021707 [Lathyrus oleraceus]|uniref:Mandelate racemase/muconate lactonizing enzyme C-terminal domain-containing protein n=1 Tax=Pisum sativum TaxID=3888 RepID=A0A9D5B4C2_PEA|nr:hypothetical protein KIW84_021707 [Pisum sativum]
MENKSGNVGARESGFTALPMTDEWHGLDKSRRHCKPPISNDKKEASRWIAGNTGANMHDSQSLGTTDIWPGDAEMSPDSKIQLAPGQSINQNAQNVNPLHTSSSHAVGQSQVDVRAFPSREGTVDATHSQEVSTEKKSAASAAIRCLNSHELKRSPSQANTQVPVSITCIKPDPAVGLPKHYEQMIGSNEQKNADASGMPPTIPPSKNIAKVEILSPLSNLGKQNYGDSIKGASSELIKNGSVGFGEVAPLEIHKENLVDAEYQLRFLIHAMKQVDISSFLSLLKGSFSYWIWNELGILPSSIFPSVRCRLEMAILNAIADYKGSNLLDVLNPSTNVNSKCEKSSEFPICALLDSNKSASEVANVAAALVKEGFSAIKLKGARGRDPVQDATLIQEVRKKVGCQIIIRVDANRNWTFEEAMKSGYLAKDCNLQCIEEPVQDEDDILKFYEESGLPVALDKTVDKIQESPLKKLLKVTHPGIVVVVIC